jgi:hypothetical protein
MCLETGTMSALKETGHLEHRLGEHWFQVCRRGAAVGEPPLSGGLGTLFPRPGHLKCQCRLTADPSQTACF